MSSPHISTVVAAAAQSLIVGLGLIGNAITIFVFLVGRDKNQDTSSVVYILNLAMADFVFLLLVPLSISTEVTLNWVFGDFLCKFAVGFAFYLNFLMSGLFLMVMSIDRCVSVYKALSASTARSKSFAFKISLVVWVIGVAIVSYPASLHTQKNGKCEPVFPGNQSEGCDPNLLNECIISQLRPIEEGLNSTDLPLAATFPNATGFQSPVEAVQEYCIASVCPEFDPLTTCRTRKTGAFRSWMWATFFSSFFIPCLVIVVCYVSILLHIYKPSAVSQQSNTGGARKRRATLVVALLVVSYVVCFSPYYVWNVARLGGVRVHSFTVCSDMRRFVMTMAYLNSAVNPILYPFIGSQFPAKFKLAIRRFRRMTRGRLAPRNRLGVSLRTRRVLSKRVDQPDPVAGTIAEEKQLVAIPEKQQRSSDSRSDRKWMSCVRSSDHAEDCPTCKGEEVTSSSDRLCKKHRIKPNNGQWRFESAVRTEYQTEVSALPANNNRQSQFV